MSASIAERRAAFRALHASGCFALPNPWDGGSAVRLEKLGFKALASTSTGAAWALGKADGELGVDKVLAHLRFLVGVTGLPINADFEAGFADTPQGVADNVTRCVETGVAGLSIEDKVGRGFHPLDEAVARLRAARAAIDATGQDVVLVGRCEAYLMDPLDMDAVIARLKAYAAAGADCLYAPGVRTLADHARMVREVPGPINANLTGTGLSVADFAGVGVRRVSVGGALAGATWKAFDGFAELLAKEGRLPS
jgi:2-methylisocitrate lyase-like PEP mutase family enzyme